MGLLLPIPVRLLDLEPPEELATPLEERLQGRDHQRLAEPPRTRQVVDAVRVRLGDLVENARLVDIDASPPDELGEIEDARVDRLHACYYTITGFAAVSNRGGRVAEPAAFICIFTNRGTS